ncbi:MAG: hypothetical protein ACR2OW_08450 [Methyloligellaceae bacterium]
MKPNNIYDIKTVLQILSAILLFACVMLVIDSFRYAGGELQIGLLTLIGGLAGGGLAIALYLYANRIE